VKRCPTCATTSKGSFPENIHGPLQYGNAEPVNDNETQIGCI
jgi:hypothetical protein